MDERVGGRDLDMFEMDQRYYWCFALKIRYFFIILSLGAQHHGYSVVVGQCEVKLKVEYNLILFFPQRTLNENPTFSVMYSSHTEFSKAR